MKFKVGDKVRIKSDLVVNQRYRDDEQHNTFMPGMEKYLGALATIKKLCGEDGYNIDVDGGVWGWVDLMLEPADNYLCINGRKIALTDEQMQQLAPEKKSPFLKPKYFDRYSYINDRGEVRTATWQDAPADEERYACGNCCTDETLMKQRALHNTLSDLLWRFAMENSGVPADGVEYAFIRKFEGAIKPDIYRCGSMFDVRFASGKICQRAIDEIVKPFLAAHPDFVW